MSGGLIRLAASNYCNGCGNYTTYHHIKNVCCHSPEADAMAKQECELFLKTEPNIDKMQQIYNSDTKNIFKYWKMEYVYNNRNISDEQFNRIKEYNNLPFM